MVAGLRPTTDQEAAIQEARDQRRSDAACATGPAKIFNDAACAIGTLSECVEAYWRYSGPSGFFAKIRLAQMDGKFESFCKESETSLHCASIDAGIARLGDIAQGLPPDDRGICEDVIAATRQHVRSEQASHAREETIAGFPEPQQKEINKFLGTYPWEYANCGTRIRYHGKLERHREFFERKVLAKMATQKIDIFRKPLSFRFRP